jgi:hypothetical protein
MRPRLPFALAATVLLGALLALPAASFAQTPDWTSPSGRPCRAEHVLRTKPQRITLATSTSVAYIMAVGPRCLTLLYAAGPRNPNPLAQDISTYVNVTVTRSTVFIVGKRRWSFTHLFRSPKVLDHNAGAIATVTTVGSPTNVRLVRMVFLRRHQHLPA